MNKRLLSSLLAVALILVPTLASATSSTYDAANQSIQFVAPNPPNTSDILSGANASTPAFRYSNVITIGGIQIDAVVSVVSLLNSSDELDINPGTVDRIDDNDNSTDLEVDFWNVSASDGEEGFVVFDVQFVASGSSTPVNLQNVSITVTDVDNNQFVQFSGLASYRLANSRMATDVQAYTGSASFSAGGVTQTPTIPSGSVRFFASGSSSSSDTLAERVLHHVEVNYLEVSTVRIRLGSYEMNGASFGVEFSVNPSFASPITVTSSNVTQPSFTKSYDANTGTGTVPTPVSGTGSLTVSGSTSNPGISKTGYVFSGWNTRADGTGVTYAPGSSILPVADITLYAIWSAIQQSAPATNTLAATPRLATTGTSETIALGFLASMSALLVVSGAFLINRRRKLG